MKAQYQIVGNKQFEYIMLESEVESPAEAVEAYSALVRTFNGGFGLEQKEFNKALDRYLTDGTGETEIYLAMSKEQQNVIQEIKKAFKRINK